MKTITTNTSATMDERKTSFSALLENFASESKDTTTESYTDALTELATAISYSVLKKCIDTGYNSTLVAIRHELTSAKATLANTSQTTLASATIGDGYDLVNTAIVSILEEVQKQIERGESIDLERPYTVRRLKKKVWIKSADSVNGWETVETSPIREVYKAVRRYINQTGALHTDAKNGYSYLEDISHDNESGESEVIYRRLSKFADLGGHACDYNGAMTFYTVDIETVDEYESMIAKLNLTKKQAQIIKLREAGYNSTAIGTYLGVKPQTIDTTLNRIAEKAIEVLDLPPYFAEKKAVTPTAKLTDNDKKTIKQMFADGYTMAYIAIHFNVSKMTISRVIKGRNDRKK